MPRFLGQTAAECFPPRIPGLPYPAGNFSRSLGTAAILGPREGWGEEPRFQPRRELDAAFFRLYLGSDEEWARETPLTLRKSSPPQDTQSSTSWSPFPS